MRVRRSSLGWLSMATCYAAEANAQAMKGPATVDIVQWLLGLTAVLISLFVLALFLRRMGHFSRLESGRFRVLAALSLGSRERVVLVQAGAKQLVLGVAPGTCANALCVGRGGCHSFGGRSELSANLYPATGNVPSRKEVMKNT